MTNQKKTRAAGATSTKRATAATTPARRRRRAPKPSAPDHARIAERAYFLSLTGAADPVSNWLQAERELVAWTESRGGGLKVRVSAPIT